VTSTRSLLDHIVRTRLKQVSNVEIIESCDVTGLVRLAKRVEGVKLRRRNGNGHANIEVLEADFVAVATGRNSAVANWVQQFGLGEPEITYVNANVGYASQMFRRPERIGTLWRALFLQAAPPATTRAGILFPVEGNRWLVTIQGGDRDYPPLDQPGFLEFTRSLRSPALYEAIKDADPIGPVSGYRATENQLFHYERLELWPESFVVLGDTVCAFNPVYGQGMTTAALAAADLGNCLTRRRGSLDGVARRFQRRLARINKTPWMLATSEDLRYIGVEGAKASRATKQMHKYMDYVLRSATRSKAVRKRFLQVQGMLKRPQCYLLSLSRPAGREGNVCSRFQRGFRTRDHRTEPEDAIDRRSSLSPRARPCCSLLQPLTNGLRRDPCITAERGCESVSIRNQTPTSEENQL
jgi:2-polyprenyl-6-methoxyphenol hydroxylase-like FAD-dependent oxidoreductase